MRLFDQKLGKDFLLSVPSLPGIYQIYDAQSQLIYIGKAKNLKRRIGQYRNARRRRKHQKMQKIIREANSIQFEVCPSELDAELLETKLIQALRPKWNIVGAFFFLYPMIGMKWVNGDAYFCYTNQPEAFEGFGFTFHGAFRSREITREAFTSWMDLTQFVGHPIPRKNLLREIPVPIPKFSQLYGFREIPADWEKLWSLFFKGESRQALEELILTLLENAGARSRGPIVQQNLNTLSRFWKHEALPLRRARDSIPFPHYPIPQRERDPLFLRYRSLMKYKKAYL